MPCDVCWVCGAQSRVLNIHRDPIGSMVLVCSILIVCRRLYAVSTVGWTRPLKLHFGFYFSPVSRIRWHVTWLLGFNCSSFVLLTFSADFSSADPTTFLSEIVGDGRPESQKKCHGIHLVTSMGTACKWHHVRMDARVHNANVNRIKRFTFSWRRKRQVGIGGICRNNWLSEKKKHTRVRNIDGISETWQS